ncbi:MAG: FlgD immunoglobulin-like domain containing protein [Candidatus Eisenbacteria bacterium]|nr:FlgD immunoglobulin-like domain containing protein [Candidatus Eisenbacteria bacterium]
MLGLALLPVALSLGADQSRGAGTRLVSPVPRFVLLQVTPEAFDRFGQSLGIVGDRAFVGAPFADSVDASSRGCVYIYDLSHDGALVDSVLGRGGEFGTSMAATPAILGIGSPKEDFGPGKPVGRARFLAVQDTIELKSDRPGYDECGRSVAVSGSWLLMGCPRDSMNSGSVLAGRLDTDAPLVRLGPLSPDENNHFGEAMCANDRALCIARPHYFNGQGRVDVFDPATLAGRFQIPSPIQDVSILFGASLSISDSVLAVGAYQDRRTEGAASLHDISDGHLLWLKRASDLGLVESQASLGRSVAVSSDLVAVGAPGLTIDGGVNRGAVYLFRRGDGSLVQRIDPGPAYDGSGFGSTLAISEEYLLVGAGYYKIFSGAVFVYRIEDLVPENPTSMSVEVSPEANYIHVELRDPDDLLEVEGFKGPGVDKRRSFAIERVAGRSSLRLIDAQPDGDAMYWCRLVHRAGTTSWIGPVGAIQGARPVDARLEVSQTVFSARNVIHATETPGTSGSVEILNLAGQRVRTIWTGEFPNGGLTLEWDGSTSSGSTAASGCYFVRLATDGQTRVRKVLLAR